ncbi:MAG: PQQ-binding-like beta-propeller repeat protein [Planctomycetaceae bacterium]
MRLFWLIMVALAMAARSAPAENQPPRNGDWPSFRQNAKLTGIASSELPGKLELLWMTPVGDQVLATCAVVGERVYVPCLSGELICLDRRTGDKLWAYKTVEEVDPNSFAPGFKSSPAVAEGTVYLGDEDGIFHAVDAQTGKARWKFATGDGEFRKEIISSAVVTDGRVLFGSYDQFLYCLNQENGELLWKFETQGPVHCSPAVVEGRTFISGCDEHLRMIDIETKEQLGDLPLETVLIASPAVRDNLLYVGTFSSDVVAVDWKTMKEVWRKHTSDTDDRIQTSAAVTEQLVIVGGWDKVVKAFNRHTGQLAWAFNTRGKVDSSPAIVGERIFFGSNDGNLYELNLADGKERWKYNVGKPISAGPAIGEGVLVVGSESRDGKVYCFGKK